jgi:hypothetical protein
VNFRKPFLLFLLTVTLSLNTGGQELIPTGVSTYGCYVPSFIAVTFYIYLSYNEIDPGVSLQRTKAMKWTDGRTVIPP